MIRQGPTGALIAGPAAPYSNACGTKDKKTPAVAIHGVLGQNFPGRHFPEGINKQNSLYIVKHGTTCKSA